jgi:hypothetical protein
MNKNVLACGLLGLPMLACAQVGAQPQASLSLLSSTLSSACAPPARCETRRLGGRLRIGAPLPGALALDFGPVQIDTVEMAYTSHGSAKSSQQVRKRVFVGTASSPLRTVSEDASVTATVLSIGLVARAPLSSEWQALARVGMGAVATSVKYAENGAGMGGVTENHLAPNLGLGLSWTVLPPVTLTLDWERTRYAADGRHGHVQAWGIGVQWAP